VFCTYQQARFTNQKHQSTNGLQAVHQAALDGATGACKQWARHAAPLSPQDRIHTRARNATPTAQYATRAPCAEHTADTPSKRGETRKRTARHGLERSPQAGLTSAHS
jgi:hypothetical protein